MTAHSRDVAEATVLIVDDDADICRALSDLLEHEGYQVHHVGTGTEAITKAKATRFTAVILDLGLPDIDGASVLRTLTDLDSHLPVIILTAFTGEEKTTGLLRQGAYAYLTKPYNKEQLKATLARAVGVKSLSLKAEQIERALSDSEQRFQSVMEAATDAIMLADQRGYIVSWNQAARQLFGYTDDEVIGKPFSLLFPGRYQRGGQDSLDQVAGIIERRFVGRTVELHGLRKDGTEFPAEFCLGLWKASEGTFYSGFIRDITERREAQARLQESEERLRLALMAASMGTWDWEVASDRVTWSEHVYRLFGVPQDAFEGTSAAFLDRVHPEDRSWVAAAIADAVEKGTEFEREYRIVWPNGEVRWLGCKGRTLRDGDGRAIRLLGTVQDITERKRAEAQLSQRQIEQQALLDLMPAMVWYKDCGNRIIRTNRLAAQSINRTIAEVEGQSTYDLYPEEAEKYYQDDLAVITAGRPMLGIVELYQTASGEKRWVQTDKVPYRDAQGAVVGVLVFAQDITERREAEEALHASEARFRAFMDNSPALAFIKDEEGHYLYANRTMERRFNRTRAEWEGKTDEELWPPDTAATCRQSDRQVLETNRPVEGVEMAPDAQGNLRFAWLVKFPIKCAGQRCIGGIAQDITDLKRAEEALQHSEQRLQSILDFCPAVIQVKDLHGRYLLVNSRWETLFHRTRHDICGVSVHDVFPKEIANVLRANDLRVIESRRPLEIEEVVLLDDGEHTFHSLKFPLVDASGKVYAVCGIGIDITESKRAHKRAS
jgi:PAS domain S-box-containing protein